MRSLTRRGVVELLPIVLAAAPTVASAASLVSIDNLTLAGNTYPVPLTAGQVSVFMTTPLGSVPTDFSGPDTIAYLRNPSAVDITSNDDAGADGVGSTAISDPARGSVLRYRATADGTYSYKVEGFGGAAGPYVLTRSVFQVGVTPGDFVDTGSNNTPATAQPVSLPHDTAKLGFGSLTTGDVDVFSLSVQPGDIISGVTVPLSSLPTDFSSANAVIELRDAQGALILMSNTTGPGSDAVGSGSVNFGSEAGAAFRYLATTAQTITVSVSGNSGSTGDYALLLSSVPEPTAALVVLPLGALAALRRRPL